MWRRASGYSRSFGGLGIGIFDVISLFFDLWGLGVNAPLLYHTLFCLGGGAIFFFGSWIFFNGVAEYTEHKQEQKRQEEEEQEGERKRKLRRKLECRNRKQDQLEALVLAAFKNFDPDGATVERMKNRSSGVQRKFRGTRKEQLRILKEEGLIPSELDSANSRQVANFLAELEPIIRLRKFEYAKQYVADKRYQQVGDSP